MPIIVARHGKPARKLERIVIHEEEYLQNYIAANPEVLPLDQLEQDIRPIVLVREFPTTSGPIDALATDQRANLYLIETKLYKNPDKRIVLAQVLDYGAALWKEFADPDDFLRRLDRDIIAQRGKALLQVVADAYGLSAEGASEFTENVKATVAEGRYRYVVLMDRVDDRLKDLISYVNANSAFDILGVGLDFYSDEGLDILIPTLHGGQTRKPQPPTGRTRRHWDETSFFADAEARLPAEQQDALRELYTWARANADDVSFGTGLRTASFGPKWSAVSPRSVLTAGSDGLLTLNFRWLPPPEEARAWRRRIGLALAEKGLELGKGFEERFVVLPPDKWVQHLGSLLEVLGASTKGVPGAP